MLIRYACRDMGLNCSFVVKGQTEEEVVTKALEHVRTMHADEFNTMESASQVEEMRKALARSTRVVTC